MARPSQLPGKVCLVFLLSEKVLNPARVHLLLKESVPCSQNYLLQVTLSSTNDLVSHGGGLKEDRANQFQTSSDVQHHIQTTGSLLLLVVGTGGAGVGLR